jgi:class 3 adenylate cyclase/tetratricopeptide (TPR) repeat protein
VLCPACQKENPEGFAFCGFCSASLTSPTAAPGRQERKTITSLFCDLVGFTATSEAADPEDIDRMLRHYHGTSREIVESFGGVVEKFIGDAVHAVFGVPAAHEDDPERAVRAGLRIVEAVEELAPIGGRPLKVRCGVNTGEALVRLDVDPVSGEGFVTGDTINTAARLQSVAPEMGVAVGEATHAATAVVFDYDELEPTSVKGKSEPLRVFHATAPRARFGSDLIRTQDTPFIGREIDLALLRGIFDKTLASSSVQLVTVVGEPGIGKSRLVAELGAHLDRLPELVVWRQGRCLPYGEGITFWALGEILKAHAGILESDAPKVAADKIEHLLPEGSEREWFRQRLLPLLGIEASSTAERDELFTAWRRFLESLAENGPAVLVFEDLHWADDAMLAFLEHLVGVAEGVPLLVIATTRPELFDTHPEFGHDLRNTNSINLTPLTSEETSRLLAALLDTTVIPAELQAPILERAEGNPLYAEEFVRLLRDRQLLVRRGGSWDLAEGAEVPFPDSVQALIAARLDTLPPDRKAILADAAVVGKVFWAGAVAAMGERDPGEVTEAMRELSRKELVRPARRSTMAGEAEYAFWHVLARDVAYSQLPRADRADRHVAAAEWIASKATERVEDLAEVLAYHYSTALELYDAAGNAERALELRSHALRFLILAGDRALGLDTAAALGDFGRALTLTPQGHPDRPRTLARFGEAALQAGQLTQAAQALEEAVEAFLQSEDLLAASRAMLVLGNALHVLGDPRYVELPAKALSIVEALGPGPELVAAIAEIAHIQALAGESEEAIMSAHRAIDLASELQLPPPVRAIGYQALARCDLGDASGLDEMREAIRLALAAGHGRDAGILQHNLAIELALFEGPAAALQVIHEGLSFTSASGLAEVASALQGNSMEAIADLGRFEEALRRAADLAGRAESIGAEFDLVNIRCVQVKVLAVRGEGGSVAEYLPFLERFGRENAAVPDVFVTCLGTVVLGSHCLARREATESYLRDLATSQALATSATRALYLPFIARAAVWIGDLDLCGDVLAVIEPRYPYEDHSLVAAKAAMAEAQHDFRGAVELYADAVGRWEAFGQVPERGFALLGLGRCLLTLRRDAEAWKALERARAVFTRLGARPSLEEVDALLAPRIARGS